MQNLPHPKVFTPWAIQLAEALCFLQARCVCHLDIKPANILLFEGTGGVLTAKLTDFGLSVQLSGSESTIHRFAGTSGYIAPEIIASKTCCLKSDIYSLGVVYWQMASQETEPVTSTLILQPEQSAQWGYFKALRQCISHDYKTRPGPSELCKALKGLLPLDDDIDPLFYEAPRRLQVHGIVS